MIPGFRASSGPILDTLAGAKRAKAGTFARRMWAGAAGALASGLAIASGISALFSATVAIALAAVTLVPILVAFTSWKGATGKVAEAKRLTEEAWLLYLGDVIRNSERSISAEKVAQAAQISVARASEMLESLARRGDLDLNITHEGRLTYSGQAPGVRVAEDTTTADEASEFEEPLEGEAKARLVKP